MLKYCLDNKNHNFMDTKNIVFFSQNFEIPNVEINTGMFMR